MKKIYQTPNTEVIAVKEASMLCVVSTNFSDGGGNIGVSDTDYAGADNANLGRRGGSFWDDEEEDF